MTIDEIRELYGHVEMTCYAYYKWTFYYRGKDCGKTFELAFDAGDNCYKHSFNTDNPDQLKTFFSGTLVIRNESGVIIFSKDMEEDK